MPSYENEDIPSIFELLANGLMDQVGVLFIKIAKEEFLETKESMRPNFNNLANISNEIINSIQDDILKNKQIEDRAKAIQKWIKKMTSCFDKGDYHNTGLIHGALRAAPIERLEFTKKALPEKAKEILKFYDTLFSINEDYKIYFENLNSDMATKPVLPFVSISLASARNFAKGDKGQKEGAETKLMQELRSKMHSRLDSVIKMQEHFSKANPTLADTTANTPISKSEVQIKDEDKNRAELSFLLESKKQRKLFNEALFAAQSLSEIGNNSKTKIYSKMEKDKDFKEAVTKAYRVLKSPILVFDQTPQELSAYVEELKTKKPPAPQNIKTTICNEVKTLSELKKSLFTRKKHENDMKTLLDELRKFDEPRLHTMITEKIKQYGGLEKVLIKAGKEPPHRYARALLVVYDQAAQFDDEIRKLNLLLKQLEKTPQMAKNNSTRELRRQVSGLKNNNHEEKTSCDDNANEFNTVVHDEASGNQTSFG